MKLKYYLRGIGIGVVVTAIIMGIALGGRKQELSDSEIRQRALELGMVDGDSSGTLSEYASGAADLSASSNIVVEEVEDDTAASAGSEDSEEDTAVASTTASASDEKTNVASSKDTATSSSETTSTDNAADSSESTIESSASEDAATQETSTMTSIAATAASESTAETVTAADGTELVVTENENTGTKYVTVTIPGGLGSDAVCSILQNAGLVDSATTFNRFLIDKGLDRYIRSGTKKIPEGATYDEIAEIICRK